MLVVLKQQTNGHGNIVTKSWYLKMWYVGNRVYVFGFAESKIISNTTMLACQIFLGASSAEELWSLNGTCRQRMSLRKPRSFKLA